MQPVDPIPADATSIHGITATRVAGAPTFPALYPRLVELLTRCTIVTYNAAFDARILAQVLARHELRRWRCQWACAMQQWAVYVGDWSDDQEDYRFQPLPGGDHTALGDCRATLAVLQQMAESGEPAG